MNNKVTVLNLQENVTINTRSLLAFARKLPGKITKAKTDTFSVALITDDSMWRTNWAFRGKDSTTDVLSFPHEPDDFDPDKNNLGDIVISAEQAAKQAAANGLTLDIEVKQLILHGLLHLCGYDHETDNGEMNARELELRDKLGI
jgi:probable rRNA maturation factor